MRITPIAVTVAVVVAAAAVPSSAQNASIPSAANRTVSDGSVLDPSTYGTKDMTSHVINAWAFDLVSSAAVSVVGTPAGSRWVAGPNLLQAPVFLPNGSRILALQVQGCDDTAQQRIQAALYEVTISGGNEVVNTIGNVETGDFDTPGCGYFTAGPFNHTVNNLGSTYLVTIRPLTDDLRFQAVRIFYRLQVSPPPGTASFSDVPVGHPQRPFIEALAASGITGGCGGGNYCPDAPLTRGQMAVFLAAALGLHWPN